MLRQPITRRRKQVQPAAGTDHQWAIENLRRALLAGRNTDGGWGYYPGKFSRLEPTCWALLALGREPGGPAGLESAVRWLAECQRASGALLESPALPVNVAFNGLAAFTLVHHRDLSTDDMRRRLLGYLVTAKGASAPQADSHQQDNSLQGWSWIDATFSWIEPTCWGLLALKKARGSGFASAAAEARIAEAERLVINRTCRPGGWNYGNAEVLKKALRPFVPTTALGLLAMQDRRDQEAIPRSLATLEKIWPEEISGAALGLSLLSLDVFGRQADQLVTQLVEHAPNAVRFGNHHGIATALFALTAMGQPHAFRL